MGAQAEHERMFVPALPRAKAAAIDALAIGCVDKIFIEFLDAGAPVAADSNCIPSHSSNPVASQPQSPAAGQAPAVQNGCAGAVHAVNPKTLDSPSTQDRTVVAYQLLWRTDAARLGPLVGTSGGACASTNGGVESNAPKLWDSASSHLSGGAAAEVAPAAIPAGRPPRVAANGVEEEERERGVPPAAPPDAPLTGGEDGAERGCSNGMPGAPPDARVSAAAGSAAAWNGHSCSGGSGGGGGGVGAPAWIRGAYSLRLWGPEFLPERSRTAGPGRAQPSTLGGCEAPTDAGAPSASPCPRPGPQAQPVSDTAAALGTLNLEGSGAASASEQQRADGPAGSRTPRRGGANAEAALRDPPAAVAAGGGERTLSAPCCAVMWMTGSDAQAMEAASDEEVC